jgi:non-heme chloroperoxidase
VSRFEVEPGVSLYAQDLGSGPAVVLIAGFGLSHEVWDAEVRELTAAEHRAVCVDLRGTGESDKPLHGYELERLTADVEAVLAGLGVQGATVVGWSFGGQIAFNLAAVAAERVGRLVLLCSNGVRGPCRSASFPFGAQPDSLLHALQHGERQDRLTARRKTLASGFAGEGDPDALRFLLSVSLRMPSWAAIASYETYLTSELVAAMPQVGVPVLQILGTADPTLPAGAAEWVRERLADARVIELDGCGHYPMFEAGPEFRSALLEFVCG